MTDDSKRTSLDGAIIIVLLTALSYATGFAFEGAYLSHHGISAAFAQVELRSLLICAGVVVVSLGSFIGLVIVLPGSLPRSMKPAVKRALVIPVVVTAFVVATCLLLDLDWKGWAFFMAIPALIIAVELLGPLAFVDQPTYLAKLEASERASREEVTLMSILGHKFGRNAVSAGLVAVGLVYFAGLFGLYAARKEETFFVPVSQSSCVVLRVYSDTLLCSEFDIETSRALGRIRLLPASGTHLELRKVGPLATFEERWLERGHPAK